MRNVLITTVLVLLVAVTAFYFWGSSGKLGVDALHRVVAYSESTHKQKDTISVMTYNLGYLSGMTNNLPVSPEKDLFDQNLSLAKELIADSKADVIGIQEIDYQSSRSYGVDQLEELSQGYLEAVRSVNWDKNYVPFPYWPPQVQFGSMQSGQAILSKYPVLNSQRIVLDKPQTAPFYYNAFYLDRLIQMAELEIGSRQLIVLNVHLEAFDEITREEQAKILLQLVDSLISDRPLIVMGDFNARPPFASEQMTKENTMKWFYEHPELSAAVSQQEYLKNETGHFTFDTSAPYEKLDYIFYNHRFINPIKGTVLSEAGPISDHLPVHFTFTWRD